MTARSKSTWIQLGALVAVALTATIGFAMGGKLDSPSLPLAPGRPDADYKKVQAVLERKDCQFLDGFWVNEFRWLHFGGDTIALNKFIKALSLCPNVIVNVKFERPRLAEAGWDWTVSQNMRSSNDLVVSINLTSKNIKLEDLSLPPVRAEKSVVKDLPPPPIRTIRDQSLLSPHPPRTVRLEN